MTTMTEGKVWEETGETLEQRARYLYDTQIASTLTDADRLKVIVINLRDGRFVSR